MGGVAGRICCGARKVNITKRTQKVRQVTFYSAVTEYIKSKLQKGTLFGTLLKSFNAATKSILA